MENKKQLIESGKQILKLEQEIEIMKKEISKLKDELSDRGIEELKTKVFHCSEFIKKLNYLLEEYR